MKYKFTVPPTDEMGSYASTCSGSRNETYRKNALWDYNHGREHDGLPPLERMPNGTFYRPLYEYAIQGRYSGPDIPSNWDDECTEDNRKEALERLKEYRANGSGFYRLVRRPQK